MSYRSFFRPPFSVSPGFRVLVSISAAALLALGAAAGPPPDDGSIAGRVIDAASRQPLAGVRVEVLDDVGDRIRQTFTTADGGYLIDGLDAGFYPLRARAGTGHVDVLWPDVPCPPAALCDLAAGIPVAVETGRVTSGVDFALDFGGAITGTVRDAATDRAILAGHRVWIWDERGVARASGPIAPDGGYRIQSGNLTTGSYFATLAPADGYRGELYRDRPCSDAATPPCDPAEGTPIAVTVDRVTPGIDFTLDLGGVITGTVRRATGLTPLGGVDVQVWDDAGAVVALERSDSEGRYRVAGLGAGTYVAGTAATRFRNELWDAIPCAPAGCDPAFGQPIEVALGETVSEVDFILRRLGSITGNVHHADGTPVRGAEVLALDGAGTVLAAVFSDPLGRYVLDGVPPGAVFVVSSDGAGPPSSVHELYDDVICARGHRACDLGLGTPIAVALETVTSGIDFELGPGARIAGTVHGAAAGRVEIWDSRRERVGRGAIDRDGRYLAEGLDYGLVSGEYRVATASTGRVDELYPGLPCLSPAFASCDFERGDPVGLTIGETLEGIDFDLDPGGRITGEVRDAATGGPIHQRVPLKLWDADGGFAAPLLTTEPPVSLPYSYVGSYSTPVLAPGRYFISTDLEGYENQLWNGLPCPGGVCDPTAGTPIEVRADETAGEIDFDLGPAAACVPTTTRLCLGGGRFAAEAEWRDRQDRRGAALAEPLTSDTGTFTFFNPSNVELVVKVLDGCGGPSQRFWVFAAGLTNQEVRLTVTDTLAEVANVYENPLGSPFAPILDTDAFATCLARPGGAATP